MKKQDMSLNSILILTTLMYGKNVKSGILSQNRVKQKRFLARAAEVPLENVTNKHPENNRQRDITIKW